MLASLLKAPKPWDVLRDDYYAEYQSMTCKVKIIESHGWGESVVSDSIFFSDLGGIQERRIRTKVCYKAKNVDGREIDFKRVTLALI